MTLVRAAARLCAFIATGFVLVTGGRLIEVAYACAGLRVRTRRGRADMRVSARRAKTAFLKRVLVLLCRICGIHIHLDDQATLLTRSRSYRPTLALANHVSYLDVVVLGSVLPAAFLAKGEVASWPILGMAGRALGMEFVDRADASRRATCLRRLRRRLREDTVCVFPEGTTTRHVTPDASMWRRGQLWAATPRRTRVLCFGICYVDQGEIAWIDDMSFAPHLWKVLRRRETRVFLSARELPLDSMSDLADARALAPLAYASVSASCLDAHARAAAFARRASLATPASSVSFVTEEVPCKSTP
jgi:1-acyl-sn-glycerol-3-phosphate acyltransferase